MSPRGHRAAEMVDSCTITEHLVLRPGPNCYIADTAKFTDRWSLQAFLAQTFRIIEAMFLEHQNVTVWLSCSRHDSHALLMFPGQHMNSALYPQHLIA